MLVLRCLQCNVWIGRLLWHRLCGGIGVAVFFSLFFHKYVIRSICLIDFRIIFVLQRERQCVNSNGTSTNRNLWKTILSFDRHLLIIINMKLFISSLPSTNRDQREYDAHLWPQLFHLARLRPMRFFSSDMILIKSPIKCVFNQAITYDSAAHLIDTPHSVPLLSLKKCAEFLMISVQFD